MKYSDQKIGSVYIYIHIYHIYPIHILYTLRWWFHLGSAYLHIYIHYKLWGEITYPFLNFNGETIEVWELLSNFIPHFNGMWLLIQAGIKVKPC